MEGESDKHEDRAPDQGEKAEINPGTQRNNGEAGIRNPYAKLFGPVYIRARPVTTRNLRKEKGRPKPDGLTATICLKSARVARDVTAEIVQVLFSKTNVAQLAGRELAQLLVGAIGDKFRFHGAGDALHKLDGGENRDGAEGSDV